MVRRRLEVKEMWSLREQIGWLGAAPLCLIPWQVCARLVTAPCPAATANPASIMRVYKYCPRSEDVLVRGRVAELADAKDLGSFGEILAGSTPVAPTNKIKRFVGCC